jgi:NAD(P) transhydrogenase subunit alpha
MTNTDTTGSTGTTVGVVVESEPDERRVALVPKAVSALVNSGVAVVVESGAGDAALLPDDLYTAAGAVIGDAWGCDVVVKVAPPSAAEVARGGSSIALRGSGPVSSSTSTLWYSVRPLISTICLGARIPSFISTRSH